MVAGAPVTHCEARGWAFDIACDEPLRPTIGAMFAELLRATDADAAPQATFSLHHQGSRPGHWSLRMDGQRLMQGEQASEVLDALLIYVSQRVARARLDLLSVHAAAAAIGDQGVLLPAPSGGGKTTLCARLLERGAAYLTDESVGLTQVGELIGYAKPLGFKAGTLATFPDLDLTGVDLDHGRQTVWHVPPARLGITRTAPVTPRLVVLPRFERDATCRAAHLAPHTAAAHVLSQAQNLPALGLAAALDVIGAVVARSEPYELVFGDGRAAASTVLDLARSAVPADARSYEVHPAARDGDVSALCFEEGGLLVRGESGDMVTVDPFGALVWPLLASRRSLDAIAEELSEQFDASVDRIRRDVARWHDDLARAGFLPNLAGGA